MRSRNSFFLTVVPIFAVLATSVSVGRSSMVQHWLAKSDGFVVVVDRPNRTLSGSVSDTISIDFALTNVTSERVEVLGIQTGCGCSSVAPIPCSIAGHSTETVRLTFDLANHQTGDVFEMFPEIYLDRPARTTGMSIRVSVTQ